MSTPNYHWVLPTVGGSSDLWGQILNDALTAADASLKTVQDSIPVGPPPTSSPVVLAHGNVVLNTTFLTLNLLSYMPDYKRFEIKLNRVNLGNTSTSMAARFSKDAGANWLSTGYGWRVGILGATYSSQDDGLDGTLLRLQSGAGFAHGTVELALRDDAVLYAHMSSGSFTPTSCLCAGANTTSGINAVKFFSVGGAALSGSYDLVGYP